MRTMEQNNLVLKARYELFSLLEMAATLTESFFSASDARGSALATRGCLQQDLWAQHQGSQYLKVLLAPLNTPGKRLQEDLLEGL